MAGDRPARLSPSPVELVDVGNQVCLFRPDNHAVALLNASAAAICADLLGTTPSAAIRDRVDAIPFPPDPEAADALRNHLVSTGFLDDKVDGDAAPPTGRSTALEQTTRRSAGPPAFTASYRIGSGAPVRLTCSNHRLAVLLADILRPLVVPDADRSTASVSIDVVESDEHPDSFDVLRDGLAVDRGLPLLEARRLAIDAMLMALHPPSHVSAVLHASTVAVADRSIVLAGGSGSGKTTLAMALVASGARYLSDDFTPLDTDGATVHPFPIAASIKQGSWPLLATSFPELLACHDHRLAQRIVRYLDPTGANPGALATSGLAVGAIIFPRYRLRSEPLIEPLSPEETLSEFLQTGSEIVGPLRSARPLGMLVNTTPAWRLEFAELADAVRIVRSLPGRAS